MIVFLDIDGVLNSWRWRKQGRPGEHPDAKLLDPAAIRLLEPLVSDGARFVLSSTWREFWSPAAMTKALSLHGFTGAVIDHTELDRASRSPGGLLIAMPKTRGQQVKMWLDLHPGHGPFVIFDDDDGPEYWAPVYERLVLTDFETGLQPAHVERARRMLRE